MPIPESILAQWSHHRAGTAFKQAHVPIREALAPRLRHARPNGPTLSGRLLWGTLVSTNLTWLEWTQIDRPRVPEFSVSIESVE